MGSGSSRKMCQTEQSVYAEGVNRLQAFKDSNKIAIQVDADQPNALLKRGDILVRKDNLIKGLADQSLDHYVIYIKYLGYNRHQLVDKCETTPDRVSAVEFITEGSNNLSQQYKLLSGCRWSETGDLAEYLCDNHLDAGYNMIYANCEHFVTFCLTRHSNLAVSYQSESLETVATTLSIFSDGVIGNLKMVTHPFYKLFGGGMLLSDRLRQVAIPAFLDKQGVLNGSKMILAKNIASIIWFEF